MDSRSLNFLDLLRSDGSIVLNKKLVKKIGLVESAIYSELVSLYKYWSERDGLYEGKWFFCTSKNLENNTSVKRTGQDRAISTLVKFGLIETKKIGMPAKKYYAITDKIVDFLLEDKENEEETPHEDKENEEETTHDKQGCWNPTNKVVENQQPCNDGLFGDNTNKVVENQQTSMSEINKQACRESAINNNRFNNIRLINNKDTLQDTNIDTETALKIEQENLLMMHSLESKMPAEIFKVLKTFSSDYLEMEKLYGVIIRARNQACEKREECHTKFWLEEYAAEVSGVVVSCFRKLRSGKVTGDFENYLFTSVFNHVEATLAYQERESLSDCKDSSDITFVNWV